MDTGLEGRWNDVRQGNHQLSATKAITKFGREACTTATWAWRQTSWWWKEGGDRGQGMFIFGELALQVGSGDCGVDGWDPLPGGRVELREKTDTTAQKLGSSAVAGHVSQQ